jgi:hypothetical protein
MLVRDTSRFPPLLLPLPELDNLLLYTTTPPVRLWLLPHGEASAAQGWCDVFCSPEGISSHCFIQQAFIWSAISGSIIKQGHSDAVEKGRNNYLHRAGEADE